jgi:hypothetical protein
VNQIEHIMQLADLYSVLFGRYRIEQSALSLSEHQYARMALRDAIEQALAVQPEPPAVTIQKLRSENEALSRSLRIALEATPHRPVSPVLDAEVAMVLGLRAKPQIITGPCGQCKSTKDPCPCGNVNTGRSALTRAGEVK